MEDWTIDNWDKEKQSEDIKKTKRRKTACIELTQKHEYKRAFSEVKLLEITPCELKEGTTYNFITGGDVDALSFLQIILKQQNLEHCLFSTWVMSCEDILMFDKWLKDGAIKKLDAYVGEVFPNQYTHEYEALKKLIKETGGKLAVFRNHSKIFAGYGEKFYFGIQTSANINTNPRTENASITINKEIYYFYKEYFDGINSFETI